VVSSRPGPYAGCVLVGEEVVALADDLGDADSALDWGRGRADVVMLRPADADDYTSVGTQEPPWDVSDAGETVASDGTPVAWMVPGPPWDMDQEGIDWRESLNR
jgi:hypothetical protein